MRKIYLILFAVFSLHLACAQEKEFTPSILPVRSADAMGGYVGKKGKKWSFPSDHLPIGMSYDDLHIVSWNVLNAKNIQGKRHQMKGSLIMEEHVYVGDSQLTLRDIHVVDLILQMINHPTHPRALMGLQECSEPFLAELKSRLPKNYSLLPCGEEAIIWSKDHFSLIDTKKVSGIFSVAKRSFQEVTLKRTVGTEVIRVVNVHLCQNRYYNESSCVVFGKYLKRTFNEKETVLVMGDANCDEIQIAREMDKVFLPKKSCFTIYSPYPSYFSFYNFQATALDHFLLCPVKKKRPPIIQINTPKQVLRELVPLVKMLQQPMKKESLVKVIFEEILEPNEGLYVTSYLR